MPAYGVEILRHKAELHETKDRIFELLKNFNEEEEKQQEKAVRKSISNAATRFERQVSPEDALEVRQKLYELFDSLHLEDRKDMLSQVCDWFVGHTPAAQKDIAILDRADKECLQRECERAWTALATDDTMRKKERNTSKQVHQFVQAVAQTHRENHAGSYDSDDEESVARFDPRLIALSDEQMEKEVEILREKVRQKERNVVLIALNIAERGSFLSAARIEYIKNNFEHQAIDLVSEQEAIWMVAEEELRRLEEQKALIYETLSFVRSHTKATDLRPPSEHVLEHLQKKRSEVQAIHGPSMLAKRLEDYGKDLEPPDNQQLTQLREETTELNNRIQRAAACKIRVSSEAALVQDYERKVAQLGSGVGPQVDVLDQLSVVLDPAKDFAQDQGVDDLHARQSLDVVEKLSKKKNELLNVVSRMKTEQLALQNEWIDCHSTLQASEQAAVEQERLVQVAQETLATLKEQHALATATMGCARSGAAPSPLATLPASKRHSMSMSRPPSGSVSLNRWVPRRSVLEAAEEDELQELPDDGSSQSRQTSGSKDSLVPERSGGRRRSLFVDPSDPNSAWSIESVVSEAVGEVLGTRAPRGAWVNVFEEDSSGRFGKSARAAQTALLRQLEKEEASLRADVEELESQVADRMQKAIDSLPRKEEYTLRKTQELRACSKKSEEAVERLQRRREALLDLTWEPGSGRVNQLEYNSRCREVEHCRMGESPGRTTLEEVMNLAAENRELMRRMTTLGNETAPLRADLASQRSSLSPRRRMSAARSMQVQEKWRNRRLRQQCRELNLLREQVRMHKEDCAEQIEPSGSRVTGADGEALTGEEPTEISEHIIQGP